MFRCALVAGNAQAWLREHDFGRDGVDVHIAVIKSGPVMIVRQPSAEIRAVADFNDHAYEAMGFGAQRRYPNEEFLRFMGSHYFQLPHEARESLKILEVGCGSGANLWMVAREGFDAYGLDISKNGLSLCRQTLESWKIEAFLKQGDMTCLDFPDAYFDVVADIFSSYCLIEADFMKFLHEADRVMKPGARLFLYTPSQNSDAFKNHEPSIKLDECTLSGIERETSAFYPQRYPFRFENERKLLKEISRLGLEVTSHERIGRTYRGGNEYFEFLSIHAMKPFRHNRDPGLDSTAGVSREESNSACDPK
jgi:ubiquinone/menaquinone biosynthesis C-methylase UbiE